jgi:hypothetical protein
MAGAAGSAPSAHPRAAGDDVLAETAAPDLDWLNKGVFISVGGRRSGGVTYETYPVA